ncbi:hypothetical protein [Labedaea rhizosphaerae]|uniref:Uncharacterized protein n=1 Tax=Labedaea rhizosphaerae TaxID=598644 RepID=A0A4R6RUD3_LABRH|nr:hypothetical protein [Labedaea rhizosphaerae]TDP90523.1 hypothetical protein EV186_11063 [Labedaea rhizosphaerae]
MTAPAPQGSEPQPMPHPNDDPDFAAARQAKADYEAAVGQARKLTGVGALSLLRQAETLEAAHTTYAEAVQGAWDRVIERRKGRYEHLQAQLPMGPAVPSDATPADRAALMAAFQSQHDRATATDRDGRAKMLDQADRFGDEHARRAAFTAILDRGEMDTLQNRSDRYGGVLDQISEMRDLQNEGGHVARGFAHKTFRLEPAPAEVAQMPMLREAAETQMQSWRQHGYRV